MKRLCLTFALALLTAVLTAQQMPEELLLSINPIAAGGTAGTLVTNSIFFHYDPTNLTASLWPDSTGNGWDLSQDVAGSRPTIGTLNGHNAAEFNGGYLTNRKAEILLTNVSLVMVAAFGDQDDNTGRFATSWQAGNGWQDNGIWFANCNCGFRNAQINIYANYGDINSTDANNVGGQWRVWQFDYDVTGTFTAYSNNVLAVTEAYSGPRLYGFTVLNGYILSGDAAGAGTNKFAQVIGYTNILTSDQRATNYQVLKAKFGL